MFRPLLATALAFSLFACSDDEPLLARAAFEVETDGTPTAAETFEDIQAIAPFTIALPSSAPDGLYLDSVRLTEPDSRIIDDEQRGLATGVTLTFTTSDGADSVTVVQLIGRISLPFPPTFVDIDSVEGHRTSMNFRQTNPAEYRLDWRACGRTFWIDYATDILSDDDAIDLAASLTDSCADRTDNPEDIAFSFDRDALLTHPQLEFQIHTAGGPTTVETFEEIESVTPFTIAVPPAFPAGTVLRSIWVTLGPDGISEETRRRVTTVSLIFSSMSGLNGFTVEQLLDERQQGDPTTPVDIRGVEGQLFSNDNGNVLSWRACDRTFTMAYPHDYLDDKAVIDFAASLNAACE